MEIYRQGIRENSKPKVSVIVPVYNVKNYLRDCLDSILNQTMQEIEVICGDGGSTDGSLEILREYAEKDARVVVISREGSGYGQSVNECMDMAGAPFVGIVESDDVVRPETYETLYNIAAKHDLDWVRADIFYYYSGMPEGQQLKRESIIYDADFYNCVLNPQTDYRPYKCGLRTWSGLYKTEFLNKNSIRHNETPGGSYQDVGFFLKTLWYANRVYFVNKAFYMWRQDNPGSSIHYNPSKLVEKSMAEWRLNREYLESHTELGKRAWSSYHYRQFYSYMWTIDMASEEMREQLRKNAAIEFQEALQCGNLDAEFYGEYEWNRLIEFIRNYGTISEEEALRALKQSQRGLKHFIKRMLRPFANLFRKIVEKSMRNVIDKQQQEFNELQRKVNELERTLEENRVLMERSNSDISLLIQKILNQGEVVETSLDKLEYIEMLLRKNSDK